MRDGAAGPDGSALSEGLGVITREEWERRYAARIMDRADWPEHAAVHAARAGADCYYEDEWKPDQQVVWWGGPSGEHMSPEDMADEEMSYWTDDGEG